MKTVPLQELKERLSAFVAEAEAGERIVVTRHGRAAAVLSSAIEPHVVTGSGFGKGELKPLFARPATRGRYLAELVADRDDPVGGR